MELSSQTLLLLVPFLLAFLYLTNLWSAIRNQNAPTRRLPPGPRGLPVIGNLHQVTALPHRALRDLATTHGAPDLMRLRLGRVPAVVASSPAAAAALLRDHDGAFGTRPYFLTAEILTYGFRGLVFSPHGEHWRRLRRLCSAHLLSPARSRRFDGVRRREVAALVREIEERSAAEGEVVVDVSEALYGFANGVICAAVCGTGRRREEGEGRRRSEVFRALIEENTALLGGFCVGDYFPSLAWADTLFGGAAARAWRNFWRWDAVLENVLQEHETRRRRRGGDRGDGDGEEEEEDFVDVLLALQAADKDNDDGDGDGFELTRDAIKSVLADMFAAGTETTFITLEWAMSELIRHPTAMDTLKTELRCTATTTTTTTPYLRAVVKETLRLHPPVPLLLPRECTRDTAVLGFHVARGTRAFVNAWAVARDPASWASAPDEFRPERFLVGNSDSEVDFRGAHFQFVPFGAGRRVCPGMEFAVKTVELALASLVRLFDWEMPGAAAPGELDMSDKPGLATRRRVPLLLVPKPC